MFGRGAADMKAGHAANLFALKALRRLGLQPAATVYLQSVVEEECTGNGALACVLAGHTADAAVLTEYDRPLEIQEIAVAATTIVLLLVVGSLALVRLSLGLAEERDRAAREARHEQFPHATFDALAHRVAAPIPAVEVSDYADALGIGCPDREGDPGHGAVGGGDRRPHGPRCAGRPGPGALGRGRRQVLRRGGRAPSRESGARAALRT